MVLKSPGVSWWWRQAGQQTGKLGNNVDGALMGK